MLTQLELNEIFTYKNGRLFYKNETNTHRAGDQVAGYVLRGYRYIYLNGANQTESRIIWILMNGVIPNGMQIDHINMDKLDNKIENLRLATPRQNCTNRNLRADNKLGFKGVDKLYGKYRASISVNGNQKSLGLFDSAKDAHNAYKLAAEMLHGQFANFG